MKVAFVYDRVNKWGGAERVLLALHEIWPEAPLYTSVYSRGTAPWASVFDVVPSFLQNFPGAKNNHEIYAPLMPVVFESFNFDQFDVVVSVTSEAAKGIITKPKALHLCYCLTPTRYLWSGYREYFSSKIFKFFGGPLTSCARKGDVIASRRPDEYVAISKTVQERIKKYYGRESQIIYPPVDTEIFKLKTQSARLQTTRNVGQAKRKTKAQNLKFFLVVSRLVKYKKVDLVIEAFNQLGWNLKIIGVGREMAGMRRKAKPNIEFLGQLTDGELLSYYQNCEAVIFPQEEDFGIVPLEAQACGKPVIAFGAGGAKETVIEGKTGLFFYPPATPEQTHACAGRRGPQTDDLIKVLKNFNPDKFKPEDCREQVEKFSKEKFKKEFKSLVEEQWKNHLKTISML